MTHGISRRVPATQSTLRHVSEDCRCLDWRAQNSEKVSTLSFSFSALQEFIKTLFCNLVVKQFKHIVSTWKFANCSLTLVKVLRTSIQISGIVAQAVGTFSKNWLLSIIAYMSAHAHTSTPSFWDLRPVNWKLCRGWNGLRLGIKL